MTAKNDLSQEYIKSILIYNPETGLFTWVHRNSKKVGRMTNSGYIQIGINCRLYMAHRLAYLYMIGKWPEYDIDHINMNKSDNRWLQ